MLEENFVDGKTITFRWSCQINRFCAWMCGMQKHGVEFIVSPRLFFFMCLSFEPLKRSELEHCKYLYECIRVYDRHW